MAKSSKTTARRSVQTGTFEIIQRAEQSLPVRLLAGMVRLRAELTVLIVMIALWWAIDHYLFASPPAPMTEGPSAFWARWGAWLILLALLVTVLLISRTRNYLYTRAWCLFDRHQLRK